MSKPIQLPSSSSKIPIPGREGQYATNLSTTPNGTIFGVTPGGSRITYDRETLLSLRNSPLSQTPPKNMAKIPGVTVPLDYHDEGQQQQQVQVQVQAQTKSKPAPAPNTTTFVMDDDE